MNAEDVSSTIASMRHETIDALVSRCIPEKAFPEDWDAAGLHEECLRLFNVDLPIKEWTKEEGIADAEIRERLFAAADRKMAEKAANYGPDVMRMVEKSLLLQMLDQCWKEHLLGLDHLRQGIGLRAYGQRDPLNEYKREAFNLFEVMLATLKERITSLLSHVELRYDGQQDELEPQGSREMHMTRHDPALGPEPVGALASFDQADPATWGRSTPRNALCPCGSGKKFKYCHGKAS
jgi:preprotein translocase subunit SecA